MERVVKQVLLTEESAVDLIQAIHKENGHCGPDTLRVLWT